MGNYAPAVMLDDGTVHSPVGFLTETVRMDPNSGSLTLQQGRDITSNLGVFDIVIVPGATLASNVPALNAFNRAAQQWEAFVADPIFVTINADMAPLGSGILGSTGSVILFGGYSTLRNAMVADASNEADDGIATLLPASGSFTLPAGFGLDGNIQVTKANAKALGFANLDTSFGVSDASMTFSTNFNFDFDRSDGVTAGFFDFESVAAHEIGHVLGFVSDVDYIDFRLNQSQTAADVEPTTLDMFRFDDGGPNDPATSANFQTFPRSMVPGNAEVLDQISAGYGSIEVLFSTGTTQGDGRQASHWKDNLLLGIMDPTLAPQEISPITLNDLRAIDLIGYEITGVPECGSLALVLIGSLVTCGYSGRSPRLCATGSAHRYLHKCASLGRLMFDESDVGETE
jgi:hypothetical protein